MRGNSSHSKQFFQRLRCPRPVNWASDNCCAVNEWTLSLPRCEQNFCAGAAVLVLRARAAKKEFTGCARSRYFLRRASTDISSPERSLPCQLSAADVSGRSQPNMDIGFQRERAETGHSLQSQNFSLILTGFGFRAEIETNYRAMGSLSVTLAPFSTWLIATTPP